MDRGVRAAFTRSAQWEDLSDSVVLEGFNDGGKASNSSKLAEALRDRPEVIAVIGHATSGTTEAAVKAYADAGIPLLMPIATSVNVRKSTSDESATMAWRMPPADIPYQAAAVAHVALGPPGARNCLVLRDLSPDADSYSIPFFEAVVRNVIPHCHLTEKADVSTADAESVLAVGQIVAGNKIDVVVLIGYGTTANRVLQSIRESTKGAKSPAPRIVLTDGAKIEDLNVDGLPVYLTFPIAPLDKIACTSSDADLLRAELGGSGSQSYELFGYDAMLMLARAVRACEPRRVSRACVREELQRITNFTGACKERPYLFDSVGENTLGYYYVFSNEEGEKLLPRLKFERELDPRAYLSSIEGGN